jgi:hypothetical protein
MNIPKPVTPREAQAVWDSIQDPSGRRVAKILTAAGRRVHHSTIRRWRAEGWRPVPNRPHPLETATRALDIAAPALTGNAGAGVEVLERRRRREVDGLSDHELLRWVSRRALIAVDVAGRCCCGAQGRDRRLCSSELHSGQRWLSCRPGTMIGCPSRGAPNLKFPSVPMQRDITVSAHLIPRCSGRAGVPHVARLAQSGWHR